MNKICPQTNKECAYTGCNPNDLLCHYPSFATTTTTPIQPTEEEDLWEGLYSYIDEWAREIDSYAYGLPWTNHKLELFNYLKQHYTLKRK